MTVSKNIWTLYGSRSAWITRFMEFLWLLAIFLVPLLFATPAILSNGYDVPKVTLYRSLVGLMGALWVIEWGLMPRSLVGQVPRLSLVQFSRWLLGQPTRWVVVAAGTVVVAGLLSTLLSPSIPVSLWGSEPATDGYSFYNTICHFVMFAVIATHLKTSAQLWRLLGAVVASGVAVGLYGISQYYRLDPFGVDFVGGVVSSLGNPIFTGAFLLMVVPVTVAMALRYHRSPAAPATATFWVGTLTVILLAIAFTQARGPWMGLTASVFTLLGLVFFGAGWRATVRAGVLIGAALAVTWAVVTFVSPPPSRAGHSIPQVFLGSRALSIRADVQAALATELPGRPESTEQSVTPSSFRTRLLLWQAAGNLVQHRPWFESDDRPSSLRLHLFGYGPEFFQYLFPLERPDELSHHLLGPIYYAARDAHSNLVHRTVEQGYLGLASFLFLLGAAVVAGIATLAKRRPALDPNYRLVMAALLAALAGRMVEQLVGIPHLSDEALFWALLALLVALPNLEEQPAKARWSPAGGQSNTDLLSAGRNAAARSAFKLLIALIIAAMLAALTMVKNPSYAFAEYRATSAAVSLGEGRLLRAMEQIEGAIALAPDVGRYHVIQANILDQAGSFADNEIHRIKLAREAYLSTQRAVAANPFDIYTRLHFAEAALTLAGLDQAGMSQRAIEESLRLTSMLPRYWLSHFLLGRAYAQSGEPDRAVEAYSEAIRLNPLSALFYDRRAEAYEMLGEHRLAVNDYGRAITLSPNDPSRYARRGVALFALGRLEMAIQDLDEALHLKPEQPLAYNNRGSVYYQLGRIERAIEDYDRAIQLSPRLAEFYVNRALAYALLNKDAEARRDVERAIELGFDPDLPR
ncbi:MAG: tetratricopeptide repeat protein [Chloroflexi bacterium]|nr:tetratricopeptide repeat protein [Chloroflexota bacterium]